MSKKNALELFRDGLDYIQIGVALKLPVSDVERKIHALRSAEKGDTSQQDYRDHLRLKDEHRIALKRRRVMTMSCRREPIAYVGHERSSIPWGGK
jgi:hypothetical protein